MLSVLFILNNMKFNTRIYSILKSQKGKITAQADEIMPSFLFITTHIGENLESENIW